MDQAVFLITICTFMNILKLQSSKFRTDLIFRHKIFSKLTDFNNLLKRVAFYIASRTFHYNTRHFPVKLVKILQFNIQNDQKTNFNYIGTS